MNISIQGSTGIRVATIARAYGTNIPPKAITEYDSAMRWLDTHPLFVNFKISPVTGFSDVFINETNIGTLLISLSSPLGCTYPCFTGLMWILVDVIGIFAIITNKALPKARLPDPAFPFRFARRMNQFSLRMITRKEIREMRSLAVNREVSTPSSNPQICNLLCAVSGGELEPVGLKGPTFRRRRIEF